MHKYEQFHEICDASPSIDDPGQWWAKMWPSGPFGSISGAPLFPQKVCKSVRFGPSGPHMSPALIDRPGRPKIGKNLCLSDSLRYIALAGSVLHFHLCIFAS